MSDEYRADDNRGGPYAATTFNWDELLFTYRGINIGPWGTRDLPRRSGYEYNWALSGADANHLITGGQATGVASQVADGLISHVVIMIGFNDFAAWNQTYDEIYNGTLSGAALQTKIDIIVSDITQAVDTVQNAGPVEIVIATIFDKGPSQNFRTRFPDATKRQRVTDAIHATNVELAAMAASRGVTMLPVNENYAALWAQVDQDGYLHVEEELIDTIVNSHEPHHFMLGDNGHEGTVIQGMFANFIIDTLNSAYDLGITPFSESELLANAGIVPETPTETPTPTPTNTQTDNPTPTSTPTDTPAQTPTPTPTTAPPLELVGYWRLEETVSGSAPGTLSDSSGTNNPLVTNKYKAAPLYPETTTGQYGNGLNFHTADHNSWAGISNSAQTNLNPAGSLTISAWVKFNSTSCPGPSNFANLPTLVSKGHAASTYTSSTNLGYRLTTSCNGGSQINGPQLVVTSNGTDENEIGSGRDTTGPQLAINQWFHFAGVYDGTQLRSYLNGSLFMTTNYTQGIFQSTGNFSLGGLSYSGGGLLIQDLNGQIDDIRVYTRALTQAEIQAGMNQPPSTPTPTPTPTLPPSSTPPPNSDHNPHGNGHPFIDAGVGGLLENERK